MIKTIMIGYSVLYGALGSGSGPLGCGRVSPHPQEVLNAQQNVFDFCYNYSMPGASLANLLSDDQGLRVTAGMPTGCTLSDLLISHPDAQAVLVNIGGNDTGDTLYADLTTLANTLIQFGKLFAFVGIIDVSVKQSMFNTGYVGNPAPYLDSAKRIASNAEILRQFCGINSYPYVDIRKLVQVDLNNITGDIIHPNQAYSEAIFTKVAKAITGQ